MHSCSWKNNTISETRHCSTEETRAAKHYQRQITFVAQAGSCLAATLGTETEFTESSSSYQQLTRQTANCPDSVIAWSVISMEVGQPDPHFLPLNTTITISWCDGGLYVNLVTMIFKADQTSCLLGVPIAWKNSHHTVQRQEIKRPCNSSKYHVIFGQTDFVISSIFFFLFSVSIPLPLLSHHYFFLKPFCISWSPTSFSYFGMVPPPPFYILETV